MVMMSLLQSLKMQVQQVLMNLCTNAWHALQDQPGSADVRLALGRLLLRRGEVAKAVATLEAIPVASRSAAASALLARAQPGAAAQ